MFGCFGALELRFRAPAFDGLKMVRIWGLQLSDGDWGGLTKAGKKGCAFRQGVPSLLWYCGSLKNYPTAC